MRHYSSTAAAMQLQGAVNGSATSLVVDAVVGLPISYPFTVVVDPGTENEEICTVTNVAGTTLTVVRGEDGTSGVPHSGGAVIRHMVTARDLREPQQHIDATSDVHGVTGSLPTRLADLEALIAGVVPVGVPVPYPSSTPPAGFYLADGQSLSRVAEPALFAVYGTTFGEGDDPGNTFALPNLVGKVIVGVDPSDSNIDAVGKNYGAKVHNLTVAEMPSHTHSVSAAGAHTHSASTNAAGAHSHAIAQNQFTNLTFGARFNNSVASTNPDTTAVFARGSATGAEDRSANLWAEPNSGGSLTTQSGGSHSHTVTVNSAGSHTHSIGDAGSGAAHNNMQPSQAWFYIIKA